MVSLSGLGVLLSPQHRDSSENLIVMALLRHRRFSPPPPLPPRRVAHSDEKDEFAGTLLLTAGLLYNRLPLFTNKACLYFKAK